MAAKDSKRVPLPESKDDTKVVPGDDGGLTTQGGGGYWEGQGVDPVGGGTVSAEDTGTGSSA